MKQYQIIENNIIYNIEEYYDGVKAWHKNGNLHREDGPAVEYISGDKGWYLNGNIHRDDGPAIERVSGYKAWYKNGKCHRDDGPAIEYANGIKQYWYNNKHLDHITTDKELKRYIKLISIS